MHCARYWGFAVAFWALLAMPAAAEDWPAEKHATIESALANMMTLERSGQVGIATVYDGNKFVQCRRKDDRSIRCEAAGSLLQPSLSHLLTGAKLEALEAFGWTLDPSFGNWAQDFPADSTAQRIADEVETALSDVYDANPNTVSARTDWTAKQECLPRSGYSQDLAGSVATNARMKLLAIFACAYKAGEAPPQVKNGEVDDLVAAFGARVAGELQRLRVNADRPVHLILDAEIGYVQCIANTKPDEFYCEAESEDSWPALTSVLTPERIARLHAAGFRDPGRAPNYSRVFAFAETTDAALARQLLVILHEVYGYRGKPPLKIVTEQGRG